MFEVVEKTETKDGALFDTIDEAEKYVSDKICEELKVFITGAGLPPGDAAAR